MLGERACQESGLGAADDVDQLKQRVAFLEQNVVDLRLQLDERDQDLAAARTVKPRTHDPPQRLRKHAVATGVAHVHHTRPTHMPSDIGP